MSANDSNKESNASAVSDSDSEEDVPVRGSLGTVDVVYDLASRVVGAERPTDVRITNNTGMDIKIKYYGTRRDHPEQPLENGVTKSFVKKPRNGRGRLTTHNFECEFVRCDGKRARIYIYGGNAPRLDNRFEATVEGIYLVEGNQRSLWADWQ